MSLRLLARHQQRRIAIYRPLQAQQRRELSLWRIPIMLLTAKKSKRRWIVGTTLSTVLGATSLIGMVAGPTVWLALGATGSVVAWRVWSRTRTWWDKYMPGQVSAGKRLLAAFQSQAETHRETDPIREQALSALQRWAGTSDGQRALLAAFRNGTQPRDLTYMPTHASSMQTRGDTVCQQIEFWLEDDSTIGRSGEGCLVNVSAETNHGRTQLQEIKLSTHDRSDTEIVPLDTIH